ncbi:MAG: zinc ribbon domain-containing protein [Pseudothermotoga sp.]
MKKVSIRVIKVDESYTSQTCSICGTVDKTSRVDRGLYVCKHCDVVMNADVNGACNICDTGPTLLALFSPHLFVDMLKTHSFGILLSPYNQDRFLLSKINSISVTSAKIMNGLDSLSILHGSENSHSFSPSGE